jgi:hypothetical protein
MGLWEKMNNPNFNLTGYREVKDRLGETDFVLSPKQWIEQTNAVGIVSRGGVTEAAHLPIGIIVFEFAS